MTIAAKDTIQRAADITQDKTSVRWQADEWVRWYNDGQRELAIYRPDAFAGVAALALVAGVRQTLPATMVRLIDIPNNTGGAAVRQIERAELDGLKPGWRQVTGATMIKHYMHDPRVPRMFEVYPPAAASGASLDLVGSLYPSVIADPGPNKTYADVVGNMGAPDIFANALLDYLLYRAFLKDAEFAGNAARAQSHYTAFGAAIGVDVAAATTVAPGVGKPGEVKTSAPGG